MTPSKGRNPYTRVVSLLVGITFTVLLGPILSSSYVKPYSAPWFSFNLGFLLLTSFSFHTLYEFVFARESATPVVPRRVQDFDNSLAEATHNFTAISSEEFALWRSPTFLYYLSVHNMKNLTEYVVHQSELKLSTETEDLREFYQQGLELVDDIANEDVDREFFGLRFLIYPRSVYQRNEESVKTLIQIHAHGRIHCLPLVREDVVRGISLNTREQLESFSHDVLSQNIEDEYTELSRLQRYILTIKREFDLLDQSHPYSMSFPDLLLIDNQSQLSSSDKTIYWYEEQLNVPRSDRDRGNIERAERIFKILCGSFEEDMLWGDYTDEIFRIVPVDSSRNEGR